MQNDPNFRSLWYVRYADDTVLGFIGTKQEAKTITRELGNFLKSIELVLC
jgi:RNA-directed DNA polymerase